MIYTLSHAKTSCAASVGNGLVSTDPRVVTALDEVIMWALNDDKLRKHTYQTLRIYTFRGIVPMPSCVEGALKVINCYTPRNIFSMMFEFMDSGQGLLEGCNNPCTKDLVDLGDKFGTFYPMPATLKVAAFSTEADDIDKEIRIRGFDDMAQEIAPSTPGEVIRVQQWMNGIEGDIDNDNLVMSTNRFNEITSVVKAETKGYVTLIAYNDGTITGYNDGTISDTNKIHYHTCTLDSNNTGTTSTDNNHSHTVTAGVVSTYQSSTVDSHTHSLDESMFIISKYGPYETNPNYRRYRIVGSTCDVNEQMVLLVKMAYVPLQHDSDVLALQNLIALQFLLKAKHRYDEGDLAGGDEYKARADRELDKQTSSFELGNQKHIDISVEGYDLPGAML